MKQYSQLTMHEKLQIKQYAMKVYGKRWHTPKPDFCGRLNEHQIISILSDCYVNKK